MYLSFGFSVSLLTVSELFWGDSFETFVILLAVLLPIKSPVASAVFWFSLFEVVLCAVLSIFTA